MLGAGRHDKSLGARIRRLVEPTGVAGEFAVSAAGDKERRNLESAEEAWRALRELGRRSAAINLQTHVPRRRQGPAHRGAAG